MIGRTRRFPGSPPPPLLRPQMLQIPIVVRALQHGRMFRIGIVTAIPHACEIRLAFPRGDTRDTNQSILVVPKAAKATARKETGSCDAVRYAFSLTFQVRRAIEKPFPVNRRHISTEQNGRLGADSSCATIDLLRPRPRRKVSE